jgi:hypothetical protein
MSGRPASLSRRRLNNSLGRPAAAASPALPEQPEEPVFWRASAAAAGYAAPRGSVVAEIPAGTVVQQTSVSVDMFDEQWVSTASSDGATVWLRTAAMTEPQTPTSDDSGADADGGMRPKRVWTRVSDTAAGASPHQPSPPRSRFDGTNTLTHPLALMPSDVACIIKYWGNAPALGDGERDWNSEYQLLLEELLFNVAPAPASPPASPLALRDTAAIRGAVQELFTDFADMCQAAIDVIVDEMFAPQAERRIPAAATLGAYFHNRTLFRVCIDTSGGVYGGDANAMKAASQRLKAHAALHDVSPQHLLHHPLVVVMTHRGYRVEASTLPPITAAGQLIAGSMDGGKTAVAATGVVQAMLVTLAQALNLKPHATPSGVQSVGLPLDAAVFAAADRRFYVMNVARLLPPVAPVARYPGYTAATTGLLWRVRPELLAMAAVHTSPDAFIPSACTPSDNSDVVNATSWIADRGIPTVGAVLGFLEPPQAQTESITCIACGEGVDSHLVFCACANPAACCMVCPQCYLNLMKTAHWDGDEEAATKAAAAWTTCDAPMRPVRGYVMKPDVTTLLHAHGVNLRYMSYVHALIPPSAAPCTAHHVEIEIIARAAKHLLWRNLRLAQDDEQQHVVCVNFFFALLLPEGEMAEKFWSHDLGPAIGQQFDVTAPFDTSILDRDLLCGRVCEMTGVSPTAESLASFDTDEPFVQLAKAHPAMKLVHLPELVGQAGERRSFLAEHMDELRAVWDERSTDTQLWGETWPMHLRRGAVVSSVPW